MNSAQHNIVNLKMNFNWKFACSQVCILPCRLKAMYCMRINVPYLFCASGFFLFLSISSVSFYVKTFKIDFIYVSLLQRSTKDSCQVLGCSSSLMRSCATFFIWYCIIFFSLINLWYSVRYANCAAHDYTFGFWSDCCFYYLVH